MNYYKKEGEPDKKYIVTVGHIWESVEGDAILDGVTIKHGLAYARKCDHCGKGMSEGFHDAGEYDCSEECLIAHNKQMRPEICADYTMDSWKEDCDNNPDDCYWTTWEELDEDSFFDEDGNKYTLIDDKK